jgi:hypothetical protein
MAEAELEKLERRQIALVLGFTSDGRRDHSVDGFSQSKRS